MHELSIAQEIISIAEQYISAEKNEKIKSIKVNIGKLQNVLSDSLEFCFNAAVQNTKMENTILIINNLPIKISCNNCGVISEQNEMTFICPNCKSNSIKIIGGDELNIKEIEIEDL